MKQNASFHLFSQVTAPISLSKTIGKLAPSRNPKWLYRGRCHEWLKAVATALCARCCPSDLRAGHLYEPYLKCSCSQ